MAGLNYGRSFKRNPRDNRSEGVHFEPHIRKWLVRIKGSRNGGKLVSTMSAHETELEAIEAFDALKKKKQLQ